MSRKKLITVDGDPSPLQDRALLVRVTSKKINSTRKDKTATDGLAELFDTTDKNVSATKRLLPSDTIAPCRKIVGQAGNYLKGKTEGPSSGKKLVGGLAPWAINGDGGATQGTFYICPNGQNEQVTRDLGAFKSLLDEERENLVKAIPNGIERIKQENPKLFDPADYLLPTNYTIDDVVQAAQVIAKEGFSLDVEWSFVPDNASDVRNYTGLNPDQVKAVKDSQQKQVEDAQQRIKVRIADSIIETARHLVERDKVYDPDNKGAHPFKDSTVDRVRDLVGVIRAVNWDNDQVLADAANDLTAALGNFSAKELREDADQRRQVAEKVGQVAKDVETAKKMDKLFAA